MNTEQKNISNDQEIDLSQLSNNIGSWVRRSIDNFFIFLFFLKRHILIIAALLIIGFGIGLLLDFQTKTYTSEVLVTSNYSGNDYLYSKIKTIEAKIEEQDSVFLRQIGFSNPKEILSIKIEPIIGIYSFINTNSTISNNGQNSPNFEMIKLLSESSDLNKVLKDEVTSKNYPNHKIIVITRNRIGKDNVVNPLLKYLNTDDYLDKILKTSIENVIQESEANIKTAQQIDTIIASIANNLNKNKNASLLVNNENSQLSELIKQKKDLLNQNLNNKIKLIDLTYIVRDVSVALNLEEVKGLNGKMKFILPILFICAFLALVLFNNSLRNYKQRAL